MQGKVEICGVNTSKLKVLKNEETMALLRRVKEGDMEARDIVENHAGIRVQPCIGGNTMIQSSSETPLYAQRSRSLWN